MNWKKEIKKPRAKKMPPCKKQKTNDKHEDGGIDDALTDIIMIPEIVDLMIKSIDEKSFVIALQDVGKQITTTKGKKKVLETVFPAFRNCIEKLGCQPGGLSASLSITKAMSCSVSHVFPIKSQSSYICRTLNVENRLLDSSRLSQRKLCTNIAAFMTFPVLGSPSRIILQNIPHLITISPNAHSIRMQAFDCQKLKASFGSPSIFASLYGVKR
jgi:hypothetical protein